MPFAVRVLRRADQLAAASLAALRHPHAPLSAAAEPPAALGRRCALPLAIAAPSSAHHLLPSPSLSPCPPATAVRPTLTSLLDPPSIHRIAARYFLSSQTASCRRETHSKPEFSVAVDESCSHDPSPPSSSLEALGSDDQVPNPKYKVLSQLKASSRHDLAMIFTCRVCETRSVKTTCRESYEKGIVVARCDGCNNLHLIADRLGWFGEPGSVEDFLASRGEQVKKGSADTLNFTLEDLAGRA